MDTIVGYFQKGGPLMWPLLACSLLVLAVILERLHRLRRSNLIDPDLVDSVQVQLEHGRVDEVIAAQRESPTLIGRVLSRGLEQHKALGTPLDSALIESGNRGLQVMHNNLSILQLVARVAPLLGLLGTVIGMILGFGILGQTEINKADLAAKIAIALITTATGLSIAIPAVVARTYFLSRIRAYQAEFEEILLQIVTSMKSNGESFDGEETILAETKEQP